MPKSLRGSLPATALLAVTAGELIAPAAVHAYVGPGAGFAFVSSLFILLVTMMLAVVTLLT